MKTKKRMMVLVVGMLVFLQGCAVAAASMAGYLDMKAKNDKPYNEYRVQAEADNLQRENQGLPPEPVKDFNAWIKEQPLTNNQIKVLSNLGIISRDEVKPIREREALRRAESQVSQDAAAAEEK